MPSLSLRVSPANASRRRTYRFAVLGMALASQFDVKEPQDLLRGLSNVLSEYELLKEDGDRPKIVRGWLAGLAALAH